MRPDVKVRRMRRVHADPKRSLRARDRARRRIVWLLDHVDQMLIGDPPLDPVEQTYPWHRVR